jgi:hypothetical protein
LETIRLAPNDLPRSDGDRHSLRCNEGALRMGILLLVAVGALVFVLVFALLFFLFVRVAFVRKPKREARPDEDEGW